MSDTQSKRDPWHTPMELSHPTTFHVPLSASFFGRGIGGNGKCSSESGVYLCWGVRTRILPKTARAEFCLPMQRTPTLEWSECIHAWCINRFPVWGIETYHRHSRLKVLPPDRQFGWPSLAYTSRSRPLPSYEGNTRHIPHWMSLPMR